MARLPETLEMDDLVSALFRSSHEEPDTRNEIEPPLKVGSTGGKQRMVIVDRV